MNRNEFDTYLNCFNTRDYERAKTYITDDIRLKFAGYTIRDKDGFGSFYQFFHGYVDEKVLVQQFAGDEENVIIDVVVRLEGKKPLTPAVLARHGYERLVTLEQGQVVEIPQLIHYRIENGLFAEIRCVIKD